MSKTAGISSDAVKKATGKTWDEWFTLLDKEGCKRMNHKEIVAVVGKKHKVGPCGSKWSPSFTNRRAHIGIKHETTSGYSVSARSKTLPVPIGEAFQAWNDKRKRAKWLKDNGMTIRKATENRSMRITWNDDTSVEVMFYVKSRTNAR